MKTIISILTILLLISCKKDNNTGGLSDHIFINKYTLNDTTIPTLDNKYKDYIYYPPKGYLVDSILFEGDTNIYRVYTMVRPTTINNYNKWYKISNTPNNIKWIEFMWLNTNKCNQIKISLTKQYY